MAQLQHIAKNEKRKPHPYRAIVVDSSNFARKQITTTLEELNVEIVNSLSSTKEAAKAIDKTDANIIILDIIMPDPSGIELIKKFQNYLDKKFFIVVSALRSKPVIIEAITSGAIDFLPKPLDQKLFAQAILKTQQRVDEEHKAPSKQRVPP